MDIQTPLNTEMNQKNPKPSLFDHMTTKQLIRVAEKLHKKEQQLEYDEGVRFLNVVLTQFSFYDWTDEQLGAWGYLIHPFYVPDDIFEQIGGIT